MINEHIAEWVGCRVKLFDPASVPDYSGTVYRLATDWDMKESFAGLFEKFTANPGVTETKALVIGAFHGDDPGQSTEEVVQLLVAARHLLPNLRHLFLGDILSEENEISWIIQSDISPIFQAYPALESFVIRGADGLSIGGGIDHASLRSLAFQSGGLPVEIVRDLAASELPALRHLEIWTGSDNYGGNSSVGDVQPFLDGARWPNLISLGLRNSEYTDAIAQALIGAPVLERLEALDLSMGTLSDRGAEALLANAALSRLKILDLHHHFMSDAVMARVKARFPQADVSVQEQAEDESEIYISVSE